MASYTLRPDGVTGNFNLSTNAGATSGAALTAAINDAGDATWIKPITTASAGCDIAFGNLTLASNEYIDQLVANFRSSRAPGSGRVYGGGTITFTSAGGTLTPYVGNDTPTTRTALDTTVTTAQANAVAVNIPLSTGTASDVKIYDAWLAVSTSFLFETADPTLSGTPSVGSTLTSTAGTWNTTPDSYSYNFKADGVSVQSGASATYVVQAGDIGKTITCIVTATKGDATDPTDASNGIVIVGSNPFKMMI